MPCGTCIVIVVQAIWHLIVILLVLKCIKLLVFSHYLSKKSMFVRFPTSDEAREDTGASVQLGPINLSWRTFFVAIMGQFL